MKKFPKYCSKVCKDRARKEVYGPTHPLWKPKAARICQWCHEVFECKPAKVLYGEGKFCSRRCASTNNAFQQGGRRSSIEYAVEHVLIALNEPFEAQKPIGPWLVDFYLPQRNLVIECDGRYWHSLPKRQKLDRQKDYWLETRGYKIVRLGEDAIKANVLASVFVNALDSIGQMPIMWPVVEKPDASLPRSA